MKKIKVKLARLVTINTDKETKQEAQVLEATLTLETEVELGDFMSKEGAKTRKGIMMRTTNSPWYIQTVTPLDNQEVNKSEQKRKAKTIKPIEETAERFEVVAKENQSVIETNPMVEQKDPECGKVSQ